MSQTSEMGEVGRITRDAGWIWLAEFLYVQKPNTPKCIFIRHPVQVNRVAHQAKWAGRHQTAFADLMTSFARVNERTSV